MEKKKQSLREMAPKYLQLHSFQAGKGYFIYLGVTMTLWRVREPDPSEAWKCNEIKKTLSVLGQSLEGRATEGVAGFSDHPESDNDPLISFYF